MSNQIQATGAVKIRSLTGVLTGASGVVSSVPLGAANGVATLDSLGKVPLSQLPASVVTYLGTWNAATNTPTLTNGVGDVGDLYICNVAGTVNFGAGPITFAVGDWVIYSGTTWQKSSGASGTVTSVGLSMPSAFTVTNSPVTTNGTLTVTGAGTTAQYINGTGGLTTFPSFVTSVGLTSSSPAFTITNTPITSSGNIGLNFAGNATQYVRGDGQLITFPTTGGGGSAIYYYLNGSIAASVSGYKQMSNVAIIGGGTDFNLVGNGLIAQFLTDVANPNRTLIPSGAWNFEVFFSMSSSGGTQKFYLELLKYNGSTFTSIASTITNPEAITGGTTTDLYLTSMAVPETTLLVTDRLAVRVYIVDNSAGRTSTLHTENGNICQVTTTFSGGISSLNGLTANTQYFTIGTSGTDFNILSASETHTFNLPTASASNRGALSSTDWTTFNNKQAAIGYTPANDSLVVHLAGIETITGIKSFSSIIYANSGVQVLLSGTASPTTLQNISSVGIVSIGRNMLGFNSNNNLYFAGDNKGYCEFAYNNAGSGRTYTLPNTSGTVALTSDIPSLSGYVTLDTTQTITGQKTFTNSQKFELGLYIKNSVQLSSLGYLGIGADTDRVYFGLNGTSQQSLVFPTTSRAYTFPDVAGTIVLGTGTSGYLTKWNGTNTVNGSVIYDNGTNVGIGNTASSGYKLDVTGTGRFSGYLYANAKLEVNDANGLPLRFGDISAAITGQTAGYIGMSTSAFSGNNGDLVLYPRTSATSKILLMGGNVGIGTSSPVSIGGYTALTLNNATTGGILTFQQNGTNKASIYNDGSSNLYLGVNSGATIFENNGSERMRITSVGAVCIGTTAPISSGLLSVAGLSHDYNLLVLKDTGTEYTSANYFAHFTNSAGTIAGGISHPTASTVSFYTGPSDARLKSNIKDVEESVLPLFNNAKLKTYNHIADEDESVVYKGFLAQEMVDKFPEAYGKDKEGFYTYNPDGYVVYLVKAISEINAKFQEQQAIITDLNERLSKLENK